MQTLTIKLPSTLDEQLARVAQREHLNKSEVVRQALAAYLNEREAVPSPDSALHAIADLVGCFSGGPSDLSTNPEHLADFGRR